MCYPQWRDWRVPAALNGMARSRRQGSVLADDGGKWRFAWSSARTSTVDRAPFAKDGLLGKHARNLHVGLESLGASLVLNNITYRLVASNSL